ncbi:chemotaxis protein CheW [Permianibacter sp. IMCC34836]|uniref:chemotaxis protein CheW n=1 Tax=Permianibacter fluminis TaxID=2738515 RepID=UPI001557FE78|nr:chemotaxis protein CheW [Permianibacter fluminis]NQD38011.1 chemotaxis protein CheW [Permianibacter fluminis]
MSKHRAEQALADYLDRLLAPMPLPLASPAASLLPHAEPVAEPVILPAARQRLQQLLDQVSEKPVAVVAAPIAAPVAAPVVAPIAAQVAAPITKTVTAPVSKPAVEAVSSQPEPIPHPVSAVASAVAEAATAIYTNQQYRTDLPASFPTLVFRVDELRLAMPLHLLGGIQRRDKPLTPLVGRADWFLGLLPHEPENINVVDTGRYLLGDKYRPELVDGYRYVIRIGDSPWGLACTDLCATRSLSQDDVSWYDSNPRRPWLAGIIKEDRCALINTRALVDAFEQLGRHAA